ncbi:MAG: TerB family tellurite resistance protein [Anaerolineales bacterium]|nr:TerB family tellurite resistance protein [Anaerolineales bacterium]
MVETDLILTLAKTLIAVSWADGKLTSDEITNMKEMLARIPDLNARQWMSVEMYIESPVDDAERARLIGELQVQAQTPENRALVFQALDDMLAWTDEVTPEERQALDEVKAALESGDSSASLHGLSRLFRGRSASQPAQSAGPNREDHLDDFINNRVYYAASQRMARGEAALDLPDAQVRKLSLAGGMMAKVAAANPEITDQEVAVMTGALQTHWQLSADEASFVVDVALSQLSSELDDYRLASEFARVTGYDERCQFVDLLFVIANADGGITEPEIEEISSISNILSLPRQRFFEAKKKAAVQ